MNRGQSNSARRQRFLQLYESGLSTPEIAKQFGISYQRVQQILSKAGYLPRCRRPKPTKEEIAQKKLDQKIFSFWANVKHMDSGCWEWSGCRIRAGYGKIAWEGKQTYAHRVAWLLTRGEIPEGMECCHHCDNPACCNPDHLFIGTHAQNMYDRNAKGRGFAFGRKIIVTADGFYKLAARPEGGEE